MNLARWSRFAEWGVAAAVLGMHVVLTLWPQRLDDASFLSVAGRDVLTLCQPALLLAWGMLGPGRWWWRLPSAAALFAIVSFAWGSSGPWGALNNSNWLLLSYCCVFAAIAGAACLFGQRIRVPRGAEHVRSQFSIRTLLIATTIVAALLAGLEYLRPRLAQSELQRTLTFEMWGYELLLPDDGLTATTIRAVVLGALSGLVAAGAAAAILRSGAPWLRLLVLAVGIPALAVYLIQLIGVRDDSFGQRAGELTVAFAALAGMTALSVLPLRLFGYRLLLPEAVPGKAGLTQRIWWQVARGSSERHRGRSLQVSEPSVAVPENVV